MNDERLVIGVLLRANDIDVGINPSLGGCARATNRLPNPLRQGFGDGRRPYPAISAAVATKKWRRRKGWEGGERERGGELGKGEERMR